MNKNNIPLKWIGGLALAHLLLYITYYDISKFWYIHSGAMIILIAFSVQDGLLRSSLSFVPSAIYGIISGAMLYSVFWAGREIFSLISSELVTKVQELYEQLQPVSPWHYFVLICIIIPGEELFWRGFVQKKAADYFQPRTTIFLSALLYTLPLLYAGNPVLLLAGIVCGMGWAFLYQWKKSLPLNIISHLIFDLLLLVILPLY